MYLKTQALVLRRTQYKDHDELLTLLSPDQGRLTVKARGLRRKNSPLTAPCQLLSFSEFTLFEYRGMYTIQEAQSIELFHGLRQDLEKLSLASYFAQVAETVSQEDQPSPELLRLVLNCLYALSQLDLPGEKIKAVFELRCACIAGYLPDLSGCHSCGVPDAELFDLSAGQLECSECRRPESAGIRMPIRPGTLEAMRYIISCDPGRLFSFRLSPENLSQLETVTQGYLTTQLERGFSALDFYKSLLLTS